MVDTWTGHDCNEVCCLPRPSNRAPKSLRNSLSLKRDQFCHCTWTKAFLEKFERQSSSIGINERNSKILWSLDGLSPSCKIGAEEAVEYPGHMYSRVLLRVNLARSQNNQLPSTSMARIWPEHCYSIPKPIYLVSAWNRLDGRVKLTRRNFTNQDYVNILEHGLRGVVNTRLPASWVQTNSATLRLKKVKLDVSTCCVFKSEVASSVLILKC